MAHTDVERYAVCAGKVGKKVGMKKEFIERVIRERVVDTRKYRYVCYIGWTHASIRRMERRILGTTEALNGWEVVKEWREK